jgi:hypothetical protein
MQSSNLNCESYLLEKKPAPGRGNDDPGRTTAAEYGRDDGQPGRNDKKRSRISGNHKRPSEKPDQSA